MTTREVMVVGLLCGTAWYGCGGDHDPSTGSDGRSVVSSWTSSDGTVSAELDVADTSIACGASGDTLVSLHGQGALRGGDVVFTMDSSGSVGPTGWAQQKAFVSSVVTTQLGTVGDAPEDNRVGVVQFSNQVFTRYALTDAQDTSLITTAIDSMPHLAQTTATRSAVTASIGLLANQSSPERAKLIVLITDGQPYPQSQAVCNDSALSDQLAAAGIELIVVAVGNFNANSISCLVDDTATDIITVSDFNSLGTLNLGTVLPVAADVSFEATLTPVGELLAPTSSSGTSSLSVDPGGAPRVSWQLNQIGSTETLAFAAELTDPALTGPGAAGVTLHMALTLTPQTGAPELFEVDQVIQFEGCDPCSSIGHPDGDSDGVADACDQCAGHDDSSDSDGDGVADGCDVCPLDPADDGDGDGLCADDDNCPSAPNPDQADADGDGLGDLCDADVDGDSVPDADDACASSDPGAVVDDSGCTVVQLCPCDGDWKNHGAYVSCVAHAAGDFVAAGLISGSEKGQLVAAAAKSGCGKNE